MTARSSLKIERKIKLVPPDGGWGWMVLFGIALTNMFNQALFSILSLLYGDKLKEMGYQTIGAAIVMSVMLSVINFSGPFVGVLVKLTSARCVCVSGSCVCALGIFLSSFTTEIAHLCFSYGVVFGIGLGFIQNASFVAINSYFKLKKSIAVGIAMAGSGIGQALMPHIVHYSLDTFGYTGACWLLSALCLHGICGTMLLQPVEWHMKKIVEEVFIDEEKYEIEEKYKIAKVEDAKDNGNKQEIIFKVPKDGNKNNTIVDNLPKEKKGARNVFGKFFELLDISLLTSFRFVNVIVGNALTYTSIQNFSMLFPFFLLDIGISKKETATCMSAVALADIFGRLVVPQIQVKLRMTARLTLFLCCIWILIIRQILANQTDFTILITLSALYGVGRSMVIVARNLTIAEHCRTDQVPSAVGLGMLSLGIISPPVGYALGWIRDYTGDYILCISAQNALLLLFLLLWLPDMLLRYWEMKKISVT